MLYTWINPHNAHTCAHIKVALQVRCRKRDEADLTDAEMRQVEADWFRNSADFGASPPCYTGVPALVAKLEELQWNVYKRVLPGLRSQVGSWLLAMPILCTAATHALCVPPLLHMLQRIADASTPACLPQMLVWDDMHLMLRI